MPGVPSASIFAVDKAACGDFPAPQPFPPLPTSFEAMVELVDRLDNSTYQVFYAQDYERQVWILLFAVVLVLVLVLVGDAVLVALAVLCGLVI